MTVISETAPPSSTIQEWLSLHSQGAMSSGDILFHAPSHVFQSPGGGENQLVQTGRALEAAGVGVRLFSPWVDDLRAGRLLHLFGMSREGLELARVARSRSVPVVLSPISWYEPRAIAALAGSRFGQVCDLLKWSAKLALPTWPGWRRELLTIVDAVLPNSQAEANQLARLFGLERTRLMVVPNGVEPRFGMADPSRFRDETGCDDDFVLYVGRIEPRKNVLGLIQASSLPGLPLVVIGNATPSQSSYERRCHDAAGPHCRFLQAVDHDDPILASAYAAAKVFALPSWFETPGLAALEAALARCSLVITPYGCTREYFGDFARYPDPADVRSIAEALGEAWRSGPDPALASRIEARYLWSDVARRTAEVYEDVTQ